MSPGSDGLLAALLALDRLQARTLLRDVRARSAPLDVIERLVRPALEEIGRRWEAGDCALSQVYMSGRICEELVEELLSETRQDSEPADADPGPQAQAPRLAIAVLEDHHLLGKQIVRTVLRAAGHQVMDYGRQDVDGLVARVREDRIEILLVSTLMLPAALRVRLLTERLCALSPRPRVIVGGAPYRFDDGLWREVGADAVGLSAGEVLPILGRLLEAGS
ncbi:cobalamin B12-binding domain-containing protein [Thiorhodococcus minor]|uniref:Cobalamin-binding protein n=1 Tax=Thiorhodococcus minor TaxID=57489 RepID=A0A6M0JSR6_9GAMM|nr:cobalamin-dependent protein [Thiorhodococcus minor]NEV60566.1 cobalamin-binding protein [Thiorhodococcus minor]